MSRRMPRMAGVPILMSAILIAACGGGDGRPEVAATVAGARIASAEIERLTEQWLRSESRVESDAKVHAKLGHEDAARYALVHLIRVAALEQVAEELGVRLDEGHTDVASAAAVMPAEALLTSGWSRADFVQTYRAAHLSRAIAEHLFPAVSVTEAELRDDFERYPEAFAPSWEARVGVAFFDTEPPARDLSNRIPAAANFTATARQLGAREATVLERATPLTPLPPPVLDVIAGLPPGQVSAPIAGTGGVVVVSVESRRDIPGRSFADAREELTTRRIDQKRQHRFMDWFDQRLSKTPVEVDGHYGRWDPEHRQVI